MKPSAWQIVVVIASFAFGVIIVWLEAGQAASTAQDYYKMVREGVQLSTITAIFFLLLDVLSRTHRNRQSIDSIEGNISKSTEKIVSYITLNQQIAEVEKGLLNLETPLRAAAIHTLKTMIESLNIKRDCIEFRSEHLAVTTYDHLWQHFVAEQKRLSRNNVTLIARITHAHSVSIWDREESGQLYDLQKEFVNAGGKIIRVLIDSSPNGSDAKPYVKTLKEMRAHKIRAHYLKVDPSDEHSQRIVGSDFLIIHQLGYVVVWMPKNDSRRIDGCIISRDDSEHIKKLNSYWRTTVEKLETQQQQEIAEPLTAEHRKELYYEISAETKELMNDIEERLSENSLR